MQLTLSVPFRALRASAVILACAALTPRVAAAAATIVRDINLQPRIESSNPQEFVAAGSAIFFFADTPSEGVGLWKSDGSAAGTVLVRRGVSRQLAPGKPAALLDGDKVVFGDREMTVTREA